MSDDSTTDERRHSRLTHALMTYGANLGAAVLSLVGVLIVGHVLGPEGRGDVAFLIAVASIASQLAQLGVQDSNANLGGAHPELRRPLAANSLVLAGLFGTLAAGLLVLLAWGAPSARGSLTVGLVAISAIAIPLSVLRWYLAFLVQAEYAFGITNLAWLSGPLTTVALNGILAGLGHLSVTSAIVGWVVGQTLAAAILIWYVSRHSGFGRPDLQLARRAVGFGLKAHFGRSFSLGNARADQWVVGAMSGSRELGLYSVAVAWADILHYVPGVLVMVQRPDLVRATREEAAALAARIFRISCVLAAGLAALLALLAPFLCTVVFPDTFAGAVDDLRILALGAFGLASMNLLGNALIATGRPLLVTWTEGLAFVILIGLDFALVPSLGGNGAAIAAVTAFTIGGVATALVFARALGCPARDLLPRGDEIPWMWRKARGILAAARGG